MKSLPKNSFKEICQKICQKNLSKNLSKKSVQNRSDTSLSSLLKNLCLDLAKLVLRDQKVIKKDTRMFLKDVFNKNLNTELLEKKCQLALGNPVYAQVN